MSSAQSPTVCFSDNVVLPLVDDADELGGVAVLRGTLVAGERWRIASEVRLRLDNALGEAGTVLDRLALPPRSAGDRQ